MHAQSISHVQLFATPWTVACQAPLLMGFPNKNPGVGCHFPSLADLPSPGIEPTSPALTGRLFMTVSAGKPLMLGTRGINSHKEHPLSSKNCIGCRRDG